MTTHCNNINLKSARWRWGWGFSLIEIMVSVALLGIIILGLVAMFNQTRRAFTSSLAQVDVLESGRAAAALISRDLEQMAPNYYQNVPSFYVITSSYYAPLVNQLANPADKWTNIVQELFFMTRGSQNNQQWNAIGYRLLYTDEQNSLGTLYRYNVNNLYITNLAPANPTLANQNQFFTQFDQTNNLSRIIDGVTHFRILAYNTNGILITNGNAATRTISVRNGDYPGQDYWYSFTSNAVPAYVEIELGILETRALERYRSFGPGTPLANNYLTTHPGAVHFFRQRIPIRNVDPTAVFP